MIISMLQMRVLSLSETLKMSPLAQEVMVLEHEFI